MGWVNREAGNQETEGSIGGETTATEKNEWLDNPFAAFRYTGGPIRSKIPPSSSAYSTTYASACAVRHPKLVPPPRTPPPRVNPKRTASPSPPPQRNQKPSAATQETDGSIGGKTTATEEKELLDDPFAAFRYTGGGASSSATSDSAGAERHPKLAPPPLTPPPRVNPKRTASHVLYLYDDEEMEEEEEPTKKKKACTDAYRRLAEANNWRPPPDCPIRLLQEPHYYDPWRVLVICILLNKTQGKQVERVLDDFFKLCPNAEVAKDVCDQSLMELIRPLGLYNKRTEYIKRFSREYLENGWTHVNQLHGVGDYAADAYAIFCVGEPEKVRPTDHKLVPYWGFLCEMIAQKGKSTI